ncbi:MAG: hypothetical protein HY211_01405 [Candidatus Omnitrophica bacterium]|nr:hypothetical protein [Candidatus Omnitrophota bacterium]
MRSKTLNSQEPGISNRPWSPEAEAAVLGALLTDSSATQQVLQQLSPDDFYDPRHRVICRTIQELIQQGLPADLVTVCNALKSTDHAGSIPASYVAGLTQAIPLVAHLPHYVNIVRQEASRRRKLRAAEQLVETLSNGHPEEEGHQLIEQLLGEFPASNEADLGSADTAGADFQPMASTELLKVLGQTIKRDDENKQITFLCALSAYTEDAQFNAMYNAPSSTGKSYIPIEISALFPNEDVLAVGYCSPTAFFHDVGRYVKDLQGYLLDLSRKILIFLDQPHTLLLQHLRPLLSHDKKEFHLKITDKSEKGSLRTKNISIKGFPAVIFCTGNMKIDEQEATRFFLLSPETTQEKIREAVYEKIRKEADLEAYRLSINQNPERKLLKARIAAIKAARIKTVKIPSTQLIEEQFLGKRTVLKPRDMRDIGRLMSLIKGFALLNFWHRERQGPTVIANPSDHEEAFRLWEQVSVSQEHDLPPYIFQVYQEVIAPAFQAKGSGLTRQEVLKQYFKTYGRPLAAWQFRQEILPMLDTAGLIVEEPDPDDKRRMLIVPVLGK